MVRIKEALTVSLTAPLLAVLGLLEGCGPIVDLGANAAPAPRIFDISGETIDPELTTALGQQKVILIEEPMTTGLLDRDRIAVRFDSGEIQYLSGLRLADRPTRLVRRSLKGDLGSVTGLTALGRGALDVPSDYRLKIFIEDFQVNRLESGDEQSVVTLEALLIDGSGNLVDMQRFTNAQDIRSTRPSRAVAGIRSGLHQTARDIRRWVVEWLQSE